MKNLIILLFVALSFYSCNDEPEDNIVDCGNATNVAYESFVYCGTIKEEPKQLSFMIFNSYEEMDKVFIQCQSLLPVEYPDIIGKRILGLFAGEKISGGYDIKIQSVVEDNCQITVEYFETVPKPGDNVIDVMTYPNDFIMLPKSNKPIVLKRVDKITDYIIIRRKYLCANDNCTSAYRIDDKKTIRFLLGEPGYKFKALGVKEDLSNFISHIPQEILALKGQTKEYKSDGVVGGVECYFEYHQGDVVTKINFTNFYSTNPNQAELVKFVNYISDRVVFLDVSK